jgi:hypothetical protein
VTARVMARRMVRQRSGVIQSIAVAPTPVPHHGGFGVACAAVESSGEASRPSSCLTSFVVRSYVRGTYEHDHSSWWVELENPLELALEFLAAHSGTEADSLGPSSLNESDLRLANRGGARISAAEITAILERRGIERGLRRIRPDASLADATSSIPGSR